MASRTFSVDGTIVAYEDRGTGDPTMVFVHGWSCDRSYWGGQIAPLSKRHRVLAIDLAGHGDSGLEREAWTVQSLGADVAAVVRHLDLQHVILIGHSMGSDVAIESARQLPGRVQGLIFVDQYSSFERVVTDEQIDELVGQFELDFVEATRRFVRAMFPGGADETLVDRVATGMANAPPHIALPLLRETKRYAREVTKALTQLNLPTIAINATEPMTDIESLNRFGVEVILMPNVGHFLMMERPSAFNTLLMEAVERLTARASPSSSIG